MDLNQPLTSNEDRCRYVKAKYIFAFLLAAVGAYLAYDLAQLINETFALNQAQVRIYQGIAVSIGFIGLLGQPGWQIQSWTGKSLPEELNHKISSSLSVLGYWLSLSSLFLVPKI